MTSGRKRTIVLLVALALDIAARRHLSRAEQDTGEYRVIVNPRSPVREVPRSFLRDAFLKKSTTWRDGTTIRPVDLSSRFAAQTRFTREVLNKTPAQLRAYWAQQIFSGKGVPPPAVNSEAEMVAYVLRNRGAVGYLPAAADPQGAIVVVVK